MSFDAPIMKTSTRHGGYCSFEYGSIELDPSLFADDWPPPMNCTMVVYKTETTEDDKEEVFSGNIHLNAIRLDSITYSLYPPDF